MPASKVPLLPVVLGFSIFGVGGAILFYWLKKNSDKDSTDASRKSKFDSKPIQLKLKTSEAPMIVGRGGATQRDLENKSGTKIYFKEGADDYVMCFIKGSSEQMENAKKLIETMIKENAESRTEVMWVPHSACGRIIGRCGETLAGIIDKCNVKIVVDPPLAESGDESQKRKIAITGLQHQIRYAQSIIEDKVKEDADLRRSLDESLAKREPRGLPLISSGSAAVVLPQREKLKPAGADGTMEVYVSALISPFRFWMQLLGPQAAALDNLVETMTEYYGKEENRELHRILSPQVGQIVAAMFNVDGKWYRAQVQEIKANDYVPCQPVLDLYFVDYGDNCYAGPLEVFELRPDFLTLRFQAIECFLANVKPPQAGAADGDETTYPEESIERFEQLAHVARWKKLWARVVSYRERDGVVRAPSPSESLTRGVDRSLREGSPVPGVELYDNENGRDINIAEELIGGGFARPGTAAGVSFGDLGKSKVLNDRDRADRGAGKPTPAPKKPTLAPSKTADDFMRHEKNEKFEKFVKPATPVDAKKKDIMEETKSFIDGIYKDAEKLVESVKQSAEEDTIASVKVKNTMDEAKQLISGIAKDALKKQMSDDAKDAKEKDRVKASPPRSNSGSDSTPPASPNKTPHGKNVDFMPAFGMTTARPPKKKTSPQDARSSANDFLKTERNGTDTGTGPASKNETQVKEIMRLHLQR